MRRPPPGTYLTVSTSSEPFRAFVPVPLPPDPPVAWTDELTREFESASLALGRLDAVADRVPSVDHLLYSFVRQEAVLSSQIEGTQSSISDLMLFEVQEQPGVPLADAREVSRSIAALERGLELLQGGLPLCTRLMCAMHGALLDHPGGLGKTPGEVRRSQVWVGGTRPGNAAFVPPPPEALGDCLGALERFLNDVPSRTAPLLKAGLAHVQFETIHPFLDGNGRIGRLLIVLGLVADGVLRVPLIFPSLFFRRHRRLYYDRLDAVRTNGDWEGWLAFFAEGIRVSAESALAAANDLIQLVESDAARVATLGRRAASVAAVHAALARQPLATATTIRQATGLTAATVNMALGELQVLGVVTELTSRRRGRVFSYRAYIERLELDSAR